MLKLSHMQQQELMLKAIATAINRQEKRINMSENLVKDSFDCNQKWYREHRVPRS
jgi:hypothetical protein